MGKHGEPEGGRIGSEGELKRRKFQAELLSGHKGAAVLVPFDPEEAWGIPSQPVASRTYGARPGHLVRGTINRRPFEGWIGQRWRRFFLPVDEELQRSARVSVGDTIEVVVEPIAAGGASGASPPSKKRKRSGK
jgi:Domain of unknown function (DUF1905)